MRLIWTGPARFVPDVGVTVTGEEVSMNDKLARSFIAQGLAESVKEIKPKQEVKS